MTNQPTAGHIRHKVGCSRPEPHVYPELTRCPECHRAIDLGPKPLRDPKPHGRDCTAPRLRLFLGVRGDLCRACTTCSGAFVIVAHAGTFDPDEARSLVDHQNTPTH